LGCELHQNTFGGPRPSSCYYWEGRRGRKGKVGKREGVKEMGFKKEVRTEWKGQRGRGRRERWEGKKGRKN